MTLSRADMLALRRRLLVIDASIQRVQLRRDAGTLAAAASPTAVIRSGWRQLGGRPSLALASLGLLLVVRLALARRAWMRLLSTR